MQSVGQRHRPVHPHRCGEHSDSVQNTLGCHGSSPRVWGTLRRRRSGSRRRRFIPTGVGNTEMRLEEIYERAVHPHGCGEHQIPRRSLGKHTGSSPRVWGTRDVHHVAHRINPVHPHGCGEHMGSHSRRPSITGSSPRVWGTPSMPLRALSRNAVHPHGCGEHVALRDVAQFISGSSPRVWGTHLHACTLRAYLRFIPTGVGNTYGSPPLSSCFLRFIPTGVGNTPS